MKMTDLMISESVDRDGFIFIGITDSAGGHVFSFTIGLKASFDLPEVVFLGTRDEADLLVSRMLNYRGIGLTTEEMGCATNQNINMRDELSQEQCRSTPGNKTLATQFKNRITKNNEFVVAGSLYKPNNKKVMPWDDTLSDQYIASVTSSSTNGLTSVQDVVIDSYEHGTKYKVKLINKDEFKFSVNHRYVVKMDRIGNDAGYTEHPIINEWSLEEKGKIGIKLDLIIDETNYDEFSKPESYDIFRLEVVSCEINGDDNSSISFK